MSDLSAKDLVVFDFDGTLADTISGIVSTARTVMHSHGWADKELGDLRRLVGPPFPQAFSMVYGLSEEEAAEVTAEYRAIYKGLGPAGWPLFDGVAELLQDLKEAGKMIGAASSKRNELLARGLEDNGVLELFDCPMGKLNDYGDSKEQALGRVLGTLGVGPAAAVMVGDRRFDAEAAAGFGADCVGVLYGGTAPRSELEGAGCAAIVDTVDELRRVLLG
ncbi:HAD family hydrolase [Paratractidigestivibacter sp.]|uniref:HAD family hydrolase n=1 Tax=Paratractidigestivibacter sp. TaxID=2847316 RepID=UPI002AC932EA|nr:HAD hydrolase-like protein [Paratractidigestivibacter sp.]